MATIRSLSRGVLMVALLTPSNAGAWIPMTGSEGQPLRWTNDNPWVDAPYLPVATNPLNSSGVFAEDVEAAVIRSLARWQLASGGAFLWDHWMGTRPRDFPAAIAYDGVSTIFFASNASSLDQLPYGAAGYTQLWYDAETGTITEFDMVLNDLTYTFVAEQERAAYNEGPSVKQAWIDDVITHELGHALGLGHTGVAGSTMFTVAWADQFSLGCDDIAGIRTIYGVPDTESTGSIVGRVLGIDGEPSAYVEVLAISQATGVPVAARVTDAEGAYEISGLVPGSYLMLVQPFLATSTDLYPEGTPAFDSYCPGNQFAARQMVRDPDWFHLDPLTVFPGERSQAPTLQLDCGMGEEVGLQAVGSGAGSELDQARAVLADGASEEIFLERLSFAGAERMYRLDDFEGDLDVTITTWSLFSPIYAKPDLLDEFGRDVPTVDADTPLYKEEEVGWAIYDTRLRARDLPLGTYYLSLRGSRLGESDFPWAEVTLDATPFAVVILERRDPLWDGETPDPDTEEREEHEAARCVLPEPAVEYSRPPGPPLRRFRPEAPTRSCFEGCGDNNPWKRGGDSGVALLVGLVGLGAGLRRRPLAPKDAK
jgi:hypothetical protein